MTGSSKILTVSYGTFSCTLEGFDDPLGTMRDLAEYFRDLAADDRYFGAEPPTPDVEMLQHIAQREVNRKVEARASATGVALTQVDEPTKDVNESDIEDAQSAPSTQTSPDPKPNAEPETTVSETGPLTFDDDFLMADEPEDILAIDPGAAPAEDGPAETVAEKLRRIRAVVSRRPSDGGTPFSQAQPETGTDTPRDRAMSETIRQIQSDLADDEETAELEDRSPEVQAFKVKPKSKPLPKAETAQPEETLDESEPAPEDNTYEDDLESDGFEPEADVEDTDADRRSMSQFLENVSEKIGEADKGTPAPTPSKSKPLGKENTDADVGRLLQETDSKLNEDGVVRRRQVISQMRAAVAATKADRAVTRLIEPEVQAEVEKQPYRNDLTDAVGDTNPLPSERPSRKVSGPPLVLVSSQRVADLETNSENNGETAPSSPAKDMDGFAKFVQLNNATGLEELLEAAAAYTIFKQGQESFSRPEIMKRVAMVDPALSQSREDGLRSFGQLLRQGKFQKLDRGQFTIDDDTRFNPDKRIAGE